MAIEAIYFYPRLKIRISGLLVAMIWVFNNDYMDYVLNKYPYYDFIERQRDSRLYCFLAKCFALSLYYNLQKSYRLNYLIKYRIVSRI